MDRRTGLVVSFDDAAAFGEVRATDGQRYFFHCTQIADGSRSIPVGTPVSFEVRAGRMGKWEANALVPASHGASTGFACPVCAAPVEGTEGTYEICPVCGWEDDPVQGADPDYAGGANAWSLKDAQAVWAER